MSVNFGNNTTVISSSWAEFKPAAVAKGLLVQYLDDGNTTTVFAFDGQMLAYSCVIWDGTVPDGVINGGYSQAQNDADLADFTANYKPTANRPLVPILADGRIRSATEKSSVSRLTAFSHDWTDPTTWWTTAPYISGETATDSGDHLTYALAHQNVIDSYHGKITGEDFLKDSQDRTFRVSVYVNGVKKTEQDPHYGSGGDYTINYGAGTILFLGALAPTDVVTADYHYMLNSIFVLAPMNGKNLRIDFAEVQFTTDIVIADTCTFQPYGFVDVFAPQLMPGIPSGTKIPLGDPVVYKTIKDYQNDAVRAYPAYPALGGAGWRGLNVPLVVFDWDYQAATILSAAMGMEIQLRLQHDTPFGGSFATATFYCISENP